MVIDTPKTCLVNFYTNKTIVNLKPWVSIQVLSLKIVKAKLNQMTYCKILNINFLKCSCILKWFKVFVDVRKKKKWFGDALL